jgi:hypothetical protein
MVPRNTSVVVQNMFSITPKPLNAIYVVLGSLINKFLGVIDHQMLTKALQRLIASVLGSSGIHIVNRALAGMVLDMGHEAPRRDRLHYLGIDPAVPLQQAKNDAFASSTTTSLPLPCTPKVGLIHLNLTRELGAFEFCRMKSTSLSRWYTRVMVLASRPRHWPINKPVAADKSLARWQSRGAA